MRDTVEVLAGPGRATVPPRTLPEETGPDRGDADVPGRGTGPSAGLAAGQPAAHDGDSRQPPAEVRRGIGPRRGLPARVPAVRGVEDRGRGADHRRALLRRIPRRPGADRIPGRA